MAMISAFLVTFVCLFIAPAQAACVNPAGLEGEKIYNSSEKMMQFCNGTNWVAMACKNTNNIAPGPCNVPWGGTIPSGSDVTAYQTASVPFGNTCTSETRSCNNNVLSGSYSFGTCTINPAANCARPWGGTVNHGSNITAYQNALEPFGGSCSSETRACFNGTLDGSYTNQTCSVDPGDCNLPWGGTISHTQTVTAYLNPTEPFGGSCTSEIRTCTGGTLSGTYTNQNCIVDDGSCALPWGGSIAHGNNVTAYLNLSEPPGGSCSSETRNCTAGSLSGSYTRQTCSVQSPDSTPNSFNFSNQSGVSRSTLIYSSTLTITGINVPTSVSISGSGSPRFSINGGSYVTSGTITNGQTLRLRLTSSSSYSSTFSATVNVGGVTDSWSVTTSSAPVGCSLPWGGSISHGSSVTAYQSSSVPCGGSCNSQTRSCNNGFLSGSYTNSNCSVGSCGTSCGSLAQYQWTTYTIVGASNSTQSSPSACRSWCDSISTTHCCVYNSSSNNCRSYTNSACKGMWQNATPPTGDFFYGVRCY